MNQSKGTADVTREAAYAPVLSVTVLNHNYGRFLSDCLESILNQTMTDFEIIVIDDCSTDNSREVIAEYCHDRRFRTVFHADNRGFLKSLREGCALSRGKYLTVISADDYARDVRAFEKQTAILERCDKVAFLFSAWMISDADEKEIYEWRAGEEDYIAKGVDAFRRQLLSYDVLHSGTFIRKSCYEAVGGYNEKLKYAIDTAMWLTLCSTGSVAYINQPLYVQRHHGSNMTASNDVLAESIPEVLSAINSAFCRFPTNSFPDREALLKKARQHALLAWPIACIFRDEYRRGWRAYWLAFTLFPRLTLFQRSSLVLGMRALLGGRGFEKAAALYHFVSRGKRRSRTDLRRP